MLCYRDRSFCDKDDCKKRNNCNRYFNSYHKRNSEKVGLLVQFIKNPDCYLQEKKKTMTIEYGKEYYDFCKKENKFDMNELGNWHEEYFKFLLNVFKDHMEPHHLSLDVGCATGNYLELFRRHSRSMYGCDVSPWYIENTKFKDIQHKMEVIENNIIPFADNMFDFVHMSQVIEHIPEKDIHKELVEIKRVLKPGGIFYISTVGEGPAILEPGQDPTHISCFSKEKWESIFKDCGFWNLTKLYEPKIKADKFAGQYDWVNFILSK